MRNGLVKSMQQYKTLAKNKQISIDIVIISRRSSSCECKYFCSV